MTPTQAQIEAAAWLVCPNETVRCQKLCGRCLVKTRKILTAAAEMGVAYSEQWPVGTVAAEVGLPTAQDVKGILRDDWLHPATIERCAQVADELRLKYKTGLACDPAIDAVLEMIAARIRALKDKP